MISTTMLKMLKVLLIAMKHTRGHNGIKHRFLSIEQVLIHDLLPVIVQAHQLILEEVHKSTVEPILISGLVKTLNKWAVASSVCILLTS